MAEAILFNVVAEIVTKLGSAVFNEARMWPGTSAELWKLKSTMSVLQAVLDDAEKRSMGSNQIKEWLGQVREVVYEVDDLLDDISVELLSTTKVCFLPSNPCQLLTGLKFSYKIKLVRSRLDEIAYNRKFLLENVNTVLPGTEQSHSCFPEIVVGRKQDKFAVIKQLITSSDDGHVPVIPIIGIGGQGKTTLAQLVFNDADIASWFTLRIWVCVSDNFNVKLIVEKILESVTREKPKCLEMEPLKNLLHEQISGKKYLIVLDDVWCDDYDKWSGLIGLLRGGAEGSRILVTTRFQGVADMTKRSAEVHELKGLSDDESWELFKQLAFQTGKAPSELHEQIGKKIVAKCFGVPLAIKATGRLLYFEDSLVEWQSFCDGELTNVDRDILSILKLSYDHLPRRLKPCFAYCGIFPKEHLIQVPKMVSLWMAQGFLGQEEMPEDAGLKCFKELLSRSLFQEVEEDEWGNLVTCKMHDLIHDLAREVAGKKFMVNPNTKDKFLSSVHHLSFYGNNFGKLWPDLAKATSLRTVMLLDQPEQVARSLVKVEKVQFVIKISSYHHLRVLDLHSLAIEKLPSSIGRLKHLRYLDLSDNSTIKTLPESITSLHNLQVLRLDWCSSLVELPNSTSRMGNLTRLGLDECSSLTHMPPNIGELASLCSISRFVVANACSSSSKPDGRLMDLGGLNKLKGRLDIINLQHVQDVESECKAANLVDKSRLQRVFLHWDRKEKNNDCTKDRDEKSLEALRPHHLLKGLKVMGYSGLKFPSWITSLHNLISIIIYKCQYLQDLPPLHHLPHLKQLKLERLEALEFTSNEGNGSVFFPSLERLQLWMCPRLKGWWKEGNFQGPQFCHLSQMTIGYCPNMTASLPLFPPVKFLALWDIDVNSMESMVNREMKEQQRLFSDPGCATSCNMQQLQYLQVGSIKDLQRFHTKLFPSFATLRTFVIVDCPELVTLDEALTHMPSLEELWILGCPNLDFGEETNINRDAWDGPTRLRSIFLQDISKMESLPWWLQFNLTLQDVYIWECLSIVEFPAWMTNLRALRLLDICGCPQLWQGCQSPSSTDWSNVAHISNVKIDGTHIRPNGTKGFWHTDGIEPSIMTRWVRRRLSTLNFGYK